MISEKMKFLRDGGLTLLTVGPIIGLLTTLCFEMSYFFYLGVPIAQVVTTQDLAESLVLNIIPALGFTAVLLVLLILWKDAAESNIEIIIKSAHQKSILRLVGDGIFFLVTLAIIYVSFSEKSRVLLFIGILNVIAIILTIAVRTINSQDGSINGTLASIFLHGLYILAVSSACIGFLFANITSTGFFQTSKVVILEENSQEIQHILLRTLNRGIITADDENVIHFTLWQNVGSIFFESKWNG